MLSENKEPNPNLSEKVMFFGDARFDVNIKGAGKASIGGNRLIKNLRRYMPVIRTGEFRTSKRASCCGAKVKKMKRTITIEEQVFKDVKKKIQETEKVCKSKASFILKTERQQLLQNKIKPEVPLVARARGTKVDREYVPKENIKWTKEWRDEEMKRLCVIHGIDVTTYSKKIVYTLGVMVHKCTRDCKCKDNSKENENTKPNKQQHSSEKLPSTLGKRKNSTCEEGTKLPVITTVKTTVKITIDQDEKGFLRILGRDTNAAMNILEAGKQMLKDGTRPWWLQRD